MENQEATSQALKGSLLHSLAWYMNNEKVLQPDNINMLEFIPYLLKLQNDKAAIYGRSYCRHGDLSIFLNLERKWDRISNIMSKAMKEGTDTLFEQGTATETFMDTVVDLASYAMLWAAYCMREHPEAFKQFVESNHLSQVNPKSDANHN